MIFDTNVIVARRNKVASLPREHYFLLREIYNMLLSSIGGEFKEVLNLGAHKGELLSELANYEHVNLQKIVHADNAQNMLSQIDAQTISIDIEKLELPEDSFDLVISAMFMHNVNDLEGAFSSIFKSLKKSGAIAICLFGPNTLRELKFATEMASSKLKCYSPKVAPFIDVKSAGRLLQRTGFSMPLSSSEIIRVQYSDPMNLLMDIRANGQSNGIIPCGMMTMSQIREIVRLYPVDSNNEYIATFEIILLIGSR